MISVSPLGGLRVRMRARVQVKVRVEDEDDIKRLRVRMRVRDWEWGWEWGWEWETESEGLRVRDWGWGVESEDEIEAEGEDESEGTRGVARGGARGARAPPLDEKFLKAGTELKNDSWTLNFFLLAGTPLRIFLATPLWGTESERLRVKDWEWGVLPQKVFSLWH